MTWLESLSKGGQAAKYSPCQIATFGRNSSRSGQFIIMPRKPVYRRNMDDAPRPVAAMAKSWRDGDEIPFHIHRRGQLIHAVSGVMRIETEEAAWIVPPALAL